MSPAACAGDCCRLLEFLKITLDDEKCRFLFAQVDVDGSGAIGLKEMERAWSQLQEMCVQSSMFIAGASEVQMILILVFGTLSLLMFLGFIFIGVAVFSFDATLGSVFNTVLSGATSLAMMKQKQGGVQGLSNKVDGSVKTALGDVM